MDTATKGFRLNVLGRKPMNNKGLCFSSLIDEIVFSSVFVLARGFDLEPAIKHFNNRFILRSYVSRNLKTRFFLLAPVAFWL